MVWVPEWEGWVSEATVEALRAVYMPDMPPIEGGNQLISRLLEIGPSMGCDPISHQEIVAWQELTGIELQPCEVRFLRLLSHEYLAESHRALKHDCPAPWRPVDADETPLPGNTQLALRTLAKL